jgi:hypothetical protein
VGPEKRDMLGKLQWLDYVEREEKITQHIQGTEMD